MTSALLSSEEKLRIASQVGEASTPEEDEWRFVVAPYVWLLTVDGTATIGGTDTQIDEDFGDLLDKLSFVLEGRFEAWKGEWGALLDLTYSRLESDVDIGPIDAETTTDLTLGLLAGMYRFVDQDVDLNGAGGVKIDGLFGIGLTSVDGEIDFDNLPSVDGDESFVDPVIGLRSRWHFSEKWAGMTEAVIGGFELFDGSELFTMFSLYVGRKVGDGKHLFFGWRSLDIDYDGGSSIDADIRISGPVVGLEFAL